MERNSSTRKTTIVTTNTTIWATVVVAVFFMSTLLIGGNALYSAVFSPVRIEITGSEKSGVPILFTLWGWIQQNQLLQTLFFGSVGTSTYFIIQKFFQLVAKRFYSHFRCEVTIHNMDPSYNAVIDYVTEKFLKEEAGATSNMQVSTFKKKKNWKDWRREWGGIGKAEAPKLQMKPNDDSAIHFFTFKEHTITFYRKKGETITVGWNRSPLTKEFITLSTWGRDSTLLLSFLEEAVQAAVEKDGDGMSVFVLSNEWSGSWQKALTKKPRSSDSVIFDVDHADMIFEDAKKFLNNGAWYANMGIPYRRGYLLYGPPGCGKTSFVQVLASDLKLDICILNLAHKELTDNSLASHLRDAPENSLVLLEDVDAIFTNRSDPGSTNGKSEGVSFSGLLNALDGVAAQEGRIFFMTTNHIEKLDPALIRPGRCDVKLEVRKASKLQLEKMFLRFFPGDEEKAKAFATCLPADEISMAQLQGHFLKYYFKSAEECVNNASLLVSESKPKGRSKVPLREYLRRGGLEEWAATFMLQGIYLEEDLRSSSVSNKLTTVSDIFYGCDAMMLDLDYEARNRMAKLLKQDESYMRNQHAFAELTDMRETFLSAYISDNDSTCTDVSEDLNIDEYLSDYQKSSSSISEAGGLPTIRGGKWGVSPLLLEKLSRKLCATLSINGKGVASRYQLHSLIDSFPHRPVECVLAARRLIISSVISEPQAPQLSLAQFLKRCLALPYFHEINERIGGIGSVTNGSNTEVLLQQLVKERATIDSIASIPSDVKMFLSSILTSLDPTTTQKFLSDQTSLVPTKEMILFACPSKVRIMREFVAFYAPLLQVNPDSEVQFPDGDDSVSTSSGEDSFDESYEKPVSLLHALRLRDIEDLAYEFSCMILGSSDHNAKAAVSLLEFRNYLNIHKFNPFDAVDQAVVNKTLLNFAVPVALSAKSTSSKWVYTFLKGSEDKNIGLAEKYWMNFVGEGMGDESDWLDGPLLSDGILASLFKVKTIGERRKIIRMHEQLLQK